MLEEKGQGEGKILSISVSCEKCNDRSNKTIPTIRRINRGWIRDRGGTHNSRSRGRPSSFIHLPHPKNHYTRRHTQRDNDTDPLAIRSAVRLFHPRSLPYIHRPLGPEHRLLSCCTNSSKRDTASGYRYVTLVSTCRLHLLGSPRFLASIPFILKIHERNQKNIKSLEIHSGLLFISPINAFISTSKPFSTAMQIDRNQTLIQIHSTNHYSRTALIFYHIVTFVGRS